jgi:hypothetical protein
LYNSFGVTNIFCLSSQGAPLAKLGATLGFGVERLRRPIVVDLKCIDVSHMPAKLRNIKARKQGGSSLTLFEVALSRKLREKRQSGLSVAPVLAVVFTEFMRFEPK